MAEADSLTLVVERVDLSRYDPESWDRLVAQCGGSMRSAHGHLKHLNLRLFRKGRVENFLLSMRTDGKSEPVGCFTIISRFQNRRFYDGIALAPQCAHLWREAMQAALSHLGGGAYEYGWEWSLEPSRQAELEVMPGVQIVETNAVLVHAVDFSQWPTWEAYRRDVSENVRRNAQKAERANEGLKVVTRTGLSALVSAGHLTRLRSAMYSRKGLGFRSLRVFLGYVAGAVLSPSQTQIACAEAGGRVLAAYHGIEFGALTYYLDGASEADAEGSSWFLLLSMVREAYDRAPTGRFLMGYTKYPLTREMPEGLMRSRRSLRVSEFPTSMVKFSWRQDASKSDVSRPHLVASNVASGTTLEPATRRSDAA